MTTAATFNSTSENIDLRSQFSDKNETLSIAMAIVVSLLLSIIAIALNVRYERLMGRRNAERELRLQQEQQEEDLRKKKACPKRRKRAISIKLETKPLHNDKIAAGQVDIVKREEMQLSALEDESSEGFCGHQETKECSICLERFQIGQDLSWSTKCNHIFHHKCLVTWLMKHDECPCCRIKIIDEETLLEETLSNHSEYDTDEEKGGSSRSLQNGRVSDLSQNNNEVLYEFESI